MNKLLIIVLAAWGGLTVSCSTPAEAPVAPAAAAPAAAPAPDFTIVALPDTQIYARDYPQIFQAQTDWIIAQRTNLNIVYVAHLGDITDGGDKLPEQWLPATNAMYRLEDPALTGLPDGIPYGIMPGNHDHLGGTEKYQAYFGRDHFARHHYFGGSMTAANQNHYDLLTAGGMDFVMVYIDFNYNDPTLDYPAIDAWADGVLTQYANRRAIVVSHDILKANGDWDPRGQAIYDKLKHHANLFLMLCGHNSGESHRMDLEAGHRVDSCLSDYQSDVRGGDGYLRLYEFSPANNVIRVKTYSPSQHQYRTNAASAYEFTYPMTGGAKP
ncbi:MAG TPA: metallophosphoesterase [Dongiaceae bacterium]|nr:metallophosphoesterase [Dongiaceae bacterium]